MSLTSHLKNPQSRVRLFLHEQFPNAATLARQAHNSLKDVSTLRPTTRLPYGTIGMALDYRLRYYFAVTPNCDLVAWHGAGLLCGRWFVSPKGIEGRTWIPNESGEPVLSEALVDSFFSDLATLLDHIAPVKRKLEQSQEELLARYCVVLALFEQVFRARPKNSPLFVKEYKSVAELVSIAEPHWVDDLSKLSWMFHERFNHLLAVPTILNPTFEGSHAVGGADADLIIDGFLTEVKATINPRVDPQWLYQLLGYGLLDYNDRYNLRGVNLYLARQGVLLQWQMSDFLIAISGDASTELPQLRERFRHLLETERQQKRQEWLGRQER